MLLDSSREDDDWFDWSAAMLEQAAHAGTLYINPIIYAEVSVRFTRIEDLDEALAARVLPPRRPAVGGGFPRRPRRSRKYRRGGGTRRSPMPDFYIGAHAAIAGSTLLTRDARATACTSRRSA